MVSARGTRALRDLRVAAALAGLIAGSISACSKSSSGSSTSGSAAGPATSGNPTGGSAGTAGASASNSNGASTASTGGSPVTGSAGSNGTTAGPTSGSAGTSGSGGVGKWVPAALDAQAQAFLALLAQARNGQPVDVYGTGGSYVSTLDGGTLTISLDLNGDGNPEYVFTWDTQTQTGSKTYDANSDGTPNYSATLTNNPATQTAEIDTTGAGVPDTQVIDIFNFDAGTHEQIVSTDLLDGGTFPDGGVPDGGWFIDRQDTTALTVNDTDANGFYSCPPPKPGSGIQGSAFDPPSAFPSGSPNAGTNASGINVFSNGGPNNGSDGSCSGPNTTAITNALNCAIAEAKGCVANMNSALAGDLASFLQNSNWQLACGNAVPGSGAQSDLSAPPCAFGTSYNVSGGGAPSCDPRRTNFNPNQVSNATPNALCQVLLHEMMHVAGADSTDNDTHDVCRDDPIYSCSRYCTACSTTTMPAGESPAQDCARCADSTANKSQCGSAVVAANPSYFLPVCHGGIGDNADCEQNIGWSTLYCDESSANMDTGFLCCAQCPAGDPNNDFVCSPSELSMGMNGCQGAPANGCPQMGM